MGTASAAAGIALIAFSLSRTFWLSAVLLVPVGASMMVVFSLRLPALRPKRAS